MRLTLSRTVKLSAILAILLSAVVLAPASRALARAPKTMPAFTLPSATNDSVIDSSSLTGKVLLINFWATWCGPCREEIPTLIKLRDDYQHEGFEVIGISMDLGSRGTVAKFVKKVSIDYPVAMGTPKVARSFGGILGIPQSFLVDRQGNIVKSYAGMIEQDVLEKDLTKFLAK